MTTTVHRNLTGADLHEPKGADTALANQVYVSDGAGSGAWVSASSIITNAAFSTGDIKLTHKATADTGWVMWIESTIGDGSSGAGLRANADTEALFTFFWLSYNNTSCPVSGGRGLSPAADFAAHKTITLPVIMGRNIAIAGAGAALTVRLPGTSVGSETKTITLANLPTGITSSATIAISVTSTSSTVHSGGVADNFTSVVGTGAFNSTTRSAITSTGNNAIAVTSNNTSGTAIDVMNPTAYVNVMVKL